MNTRRFLYKPHCDCHMCREGIPWTLVKCVVFIGFVVLLAVN